MPNVAPVVASISVAGSKLRPLSRCEFLRHRLAKVFSPRLSGYAVRPLLQRARAGLDDVRRSGKIRLAAHQRDQTLALRLELAHLGEDRVDGGGAQRLKRPARGEAVASIKRSIATSR